MTCRPFFDALRQTVDEREGTRFKLMSERSKDFLTLGVAPDAFVEVDVIDGLTPADLEELDRQWEGPLFDLVAKLTHAGFTSFALPPSWGWSFHEIVGEEQKPEWRVVGIEHEDRWQGIFIVDTYEHPCHHMRNATAVYPCYIGAAPWNMGYYNKRLGITPRFDDVGIALLANATRPSEEQGCEGRVIIHAAPGSEGFYRRCGITELGPDESHPSECVRFEITSKQARAIRGERS